MNLSALNNTSANSLTGAASEISANVAEVERSKSASVFGADFANFLHNQVQAVRHNTRPTLAASDKALPQAGSKSFDPAGQRPQNTSANKNDSRSDNDLRSNDRKAIDRDDNKASAKRAQDKEARVAESEQTETAAEVAADTELLSDLSAQASDQAAALTTIAVSDNLQIITTANTSASEQSLADFALAMGLDPNQVKSLFGESAANAATAKLANNNISTQQMLGINTQPFSLTSDSLANAAASGQSLNLTAGLKAGQVLNTENTPISTADFQELKTQMPTVDQGTKDLMGKMENLQFQIGTNPAVQQAQNIQQPISTLAVLSMMDAHLRAEDIEALKTQFDTGMAIDTAHPITDTNQPAPQPHMPTRAANNSQAPAAPAFINNPDMAQTYDKLSQKLSTELAARMHEKLNAGEWKMKFALKPASLGLVDVQLEMKDGKLSAHFQSDTNLTKDLLQNGSQRLKDALADLGMNNASVFVGQGETQRQYGQNPPNLSGGRSQADDNREKLSEETGLKIAEDSLPRRSSSSQFDSYA